MNQFRLIILLQLLLVGNCFVFRPKGRLSWTSSKQIPISKNHQTVRNLFGFDKNKVVQPTGQGSLTQAQINEQVRLATSCQEMMAKALAAQTLKVEQNGISVTYSGDLNPISINISEDAIGKGAAQLSESLIVAIKEMHVKAQTLMKDTMADIQKKMIPPK
mmetsp:Transcript_53708/g.68980  ORF Transcript_53708/g.68980 Transcript_53708/m.68980 type:complete len:161 (-) Transcript_53708:176-658(-)